MPRATIDYDRIELEPAPNRFLDEGTLRSTAQLSDQSLPGQSTAARELAYAKRAAQYESGLPEQYALIRYGAGPAPRRAEHSVRLPGQTVTMIYDRTLHQQLLQIYVVHGWTGIEAVQKALKQAKTSARTGPLHPWEYVTSFFGFTRGLLILSIREALMEIEKKAAERLVLELSLSARLVNQVWAKLDIRSSTTNARGQTQNVPTGKTSPSWDTPITVKRIFYRFGNTDCAARLYPLVHRAVQAHTDIAHLKELRDQKDSKLRPVHDDFTTLEEVAAIMKEVADLDAEISRMESEIGTLYEDVNAECPLVLLAVPLLELPFDREAMEQTVGECLANFYGESERIAAAHNQYDRVATLIPGDRPDTSPELLFSPGFAPERTVVKAVLDGALDDLGLLALMSEEILRRIAQNGPVPFDSFEYVVLMHYITVLQRELIDEKETAEAVEHVVTKVSALLSLVLSASPPGRVVSALSSILAVSVLTYVTYSTVHRLAILDRQLGQRLAGFDRQSAAEMVALGELAQMRASYLKEITANVLKEIALIVAAGAVPNFRHLLHVRGFYLDLETLAGA
jgi:hypothetical protein